MTDAPEPIKSAELEFEYEKGNLFRVIHVDGGHGGISPDGQTIVLSVFSERFPIPKKEVCEIDRAGQVQWPPKIRVGRTGVFREVEATLVMNHSTAVLIARWLNEQIGKQNELFAQMMAVQKASTKADSTS
jgi:hypothetical protein